VVDTVVDPAGVFVEGPVVIGTHAPFLRSWPAGQLVFVGPVLNEAIAAASLFILSWAAAAWAAFTLDQSVGATDVAVPVLVV
jgi:hypothetical protein